MYKAPRTIKIADAYTDQSPLQFEFAKRPRLFFHAWLLTDRASGNVWDVDHWSSMYTRIEIKINVEKCKVVR